MELDHNFFYHIIFLLKFWFFLYNIKEWKPSEVFRHHISTFLSGHTIWASAYHMVVHYYVRVVSLNWFGCESLVDSEELWQQKCPKIPKSDKNSQKRQNACDFRQLLTYRQVLRTRYRERGDKSWVINPRRMSSGDKSKWW